MNKNTIKNGIYNHQVQFYLEVNDFDQLHQVQVQSHQRLQHDLSMHNILLGKKLIIKIFIYRIIFTMLTIQTKCS
jgi:hypothetical protein